MMDLTKIEKPFCWLSTEERKALMDHNGEAQLLDDNGEWINKSVSHGFVDGWIYRAKPQPVRGDVVFTGSMLEHCSLLNGRDYAQHKCPARVTFTTSDGKLIPGTYTGPDGATIAVEAL